MRTNKLLLICLLFFYANIQAKSQDIYELFDALLHVEELVQVEKDLLLGGGEVPSFSFKESSFYLKRLGSKVQISWSLKGSANFYIERSADGKSWERFDTKVDIISENTYQALDDKPVNGLVYYRIGLENSLGYTSYSSAQYIHTREKIDLGGFTTKSLSYHQ